jgi:UDPglucose 6-dehydrogenase
VDFQKRILCIGAGYVGGPTMAVIADKCPQYRIELVDVNPERIRQWNSDNLPIYEPGLDEIVFRNRGRNLFFSTEVARGIEESDIIFVSVNTPTKTFGQGAGQAANLEYVEAVARLILKHAKGDKIIVEKSTVPVRTAQALQRILASGASPLHFEVLSNPEFLAEGTAIEDLLAPDRILVGCMETESGHKACDQLSASTKTGSQGPYPAHQRVEFRTFETHRQRLPGPARLLDQLDFRPVRKNRRQRP